MWQLESHVLLQVLMALSLSPPSAFATPWPQVFGDASLSSKVSGWNATLERAVGAPERVSVSQAERPSWSRVVVGDGGRLIWQAGGAMHCMETAPGGESTCAGFPVSLSGLSCGSAAAVGGLMRVVCRNRDSDADRTHVVLHSVRLGTAGAPASLDTTMVPCGVGGYAYTPPTSEVTWIDDIGVLTRATPLFNFFCAFQVNGVQVAHSGMFRSEDPQILNMPAFVKCRIALRRAESGVIHAVLTGRMRFRFQDLPVALYFKISVDEHAKSTIVFYDFDMVHSRPIDIQTSYAIDHRASYSLRSGSAIVVTKLDAFYEKREYICVCSYEHCTSYLAFAYSRITGSSELKIHHPIEVPQREASPDREEYIVATDPGRGHWLSVVIGRDGKGNPSIYFAPGYWVPQYMYPAAVIGGRIYGGGNDDMGYVGFFPGGWYYVLETAQVLQEDLSMDGISSTTVVPVTVGDSPSDDHFSMAYVMDSSYKSRRTVVTLRAAKGSGGDTSTQTMCQGVGGKWVTIPNGGGVCVPESARVVIPSTSTPDPTSDPSPALAEKGGKTISTGAFVILTVIPFIAFALGAMTAFAFSRRCRHRNANPNGNVSLLVMNAEEEHGGEQEPE